MNRVIVCRWLTLLGYFGLMAFIFGWHIFIKPLPPEYISFILAIQLGPLMFPLRGLLYGKTYTHAWASYLALFYFVIGIWYAAGDETSLFGILICAFSLAFFIGAVLYARFAGQANTATPG